MPRLQFTLNDYVVYVFASHRKRLLVEGVGDYHLFCRLLSLHGNKKVQVDIDDASCLIGFETGTGNREKVERVCSVIKGRDFSKKLVGFVDREFRGFSWATELKDDITHHRVDDRLVWTRGHSVENYYFEFNTLRNPIAMLSTTRHFEAALDIFEKNFERIIKTACVLSLLGLEFSNFEKIRSSLSWSLFYLNNGEIFIDTKELEKTLKQRKAPKELVDSLVTQYKHWEQLVSKADFDIVRWMCHGHMGLTVIWASYKAAVFEVSKRAGDAKPSSEVEHALESKDEVRFNACAQRWAERALGNENTFPLEVLRMLDVVS